MLARIFVLDIRFDTSRVSESGLLTNPECSMGREKGVVKWFSTDKGYGFIRREGGDEIFVHHTDIDVEGYAALKNGETVEFDVFESDRGPKARNLVPLDAEGAPRAPSKSTAKSPAAGSASGKAPAAGVEAAESGKRKKSGGRSGREAPAEKKSLASILRERLGKRFPGFEG